MCVCVCVCVSLSLSLCVSLCVCMCVQTRRVCTESSLLLCLLRSCCCTRPRWVSTITPCSCSTAPLTHPAGSSTSCRRRWRSPCRDSTGAKTYAHNPACKETTSHLILSFTENILQSHYKTHSKCGISTIVLKKFLMLIKAAFI